jgi:hypothetical protein
MFDYWRDNSGGAVSLAGSEVHGWFDLPLSLATAQGWTWPGVRTDLMRVCMAAADAEVDFRPFHGIVACINAVIDSGSAGRQELPADGASKTFGLGQPRPGRLVPHLRRPRDGSRLRAAALLQRRPGSGGVRGRLGHHERDGLRRLVAAVL